jgi:hypothetical protein
MTQKVVSHDEAVTESNNFFSIFGIFGRYATNLRGTSVENVKKVQNQPTLLLYLVTQKIQLRKRNW